MVFAKVKQSAFLLEVCQNELCTTVTSPYFGRYFLLTDYGDRTGVHNSA